jgi:predicted enzyme related to lactoylglutathione lyase
MMRLGRAAPTIAVADIERATRFYERAFGFGKTFENGDPVAFVILKRDDAEIHLTRVAAHAGAAHNVMHLVVVSGVEEIYRRCEAEGAPIVERMRDAPWGMRTFVVADPDGNRIDVGQPL